MMGFDVQVSGGLAHLALSHESIEKGREVLEGLPGPPKMVTRHQVTCFCSGALAAPVPLVR
jgi:hypothetical protein